MILSARSRTTNADGGCDVNVRYFCGLIEEAETVERPHGKWILEETDYDDGGNNLYECNICHHRDTHSGSIEVPYCWHCGADMRGDEE